VGLGGGQMLIGLWPKHWLTLFSSGMLKKITEAELPTQGHKGG